VKLLVDTHILLWWLADDTRLPPAAHGAISDPRNTAVVSAASIWETSIKAAIGRLRIRDSLLDAVKADGFEFLSITARHAWTAGALPLFHTDPFDRMLVAQAGDEELTLVSIDPAFASYEVDLLPLS